MLGGWRERFAFLEALVRPNRLRSCGLPAHPEAAIGLDRQLFAGEVRCPASQVVQLPAQKGSFSPEKSVRTEAGNCGSPKAVRPVVIRRQD